LLLVTFVLVVLPFYTFVPLCYLIRSFCYVAVTRSHCVPDYVCYHYVAFDLVWLLPTHVRYVTLFVTFTLGSFVRYVVLWFFGCTLRLPVCTTVAGLLPFARSVLGLLLRLLLRYSSRCVTFVLRLPLVCCLRYRFVLLRCAV